MKKHSEDVHIENSGPRPGVSKAKSASSRHAGVTDARPISRLETPVNKFVCSPLDRRTVTVLIARPWMEHPL